jgi:hypothetical protein
MTWPVNDTFSDSNGTLLSGTGVSVDGNGYTVRTSDSGSQLAPVAGSLAAFGAYEVQAGAVYRKTSGAGTVYLYYVDNPGAVTTDQVTAVYKCFTNASTYIALTIHRYFQLRYYFATSGSFTAGTWYLFDSTGGGLVGAQAGTTLVSGAASFSDPGRFTFGTAGTAVSNTVSYKLSGTNPASGGFTVEVIANGTTLAWAPNFTTTYSSGNLYPVGWAMEGNVVGTPGSQTGVHMDSFTYGAGAVPATSAVITGPAVVGVTLATPTDYTIRGLVGGSEGGVFKLALVPTGAVLGTAATFALSDGSGSFSGTNVASNVLTIPAGSTQGFFSYTAAGVGTKTITATAGGSASGFSAATFQTVSSANIIIIDGDSRSDCRSGNTSTTVYAPNLNVWPVLLQQRLKTSAALYCFAVSGQSVEAELADQSSEIIARINSVITFGGVVRIVHWGGGNGINARSVSNGSDTTTQVGTYIGNQVATYCSACKTAGAKVFVVTDPRRANNGNAGAGYALWRGAQDQANFNAAIDQINSLIVANWRTYADGIFHWAFDDRCSNPQYTGGIFSDGTHFNPFDATTSTHAAAAGSSDFAEAIFTLYAANALGMTGFSANSGGAYVFGD